MIFCCPAKRSDTAAEHDTMRQMVRENYFATMEIPFLRGREFTPQDNLHAPAVAIVNQTFQHEFFPNEDVLGKHITFNVDEKGEVEIIGVVADTKYDRQREQNQPLLYTPWQQEVSEHRRDAFRLAHYGQSGGAGGTGASSRPRARQ